MAEPDLPRFAHFEGVEPEKLQDLYINHAEVARQVHQDSLRRFTGNNTLTVDLVRENAIAPEQPDAMVARLQQYDSVSISSRIGLGSIVNQRGMANLETVVAYRQAFAERDMPVIVEVAGNEALTEARIMHRVSDFARNSLVVGEANMGQGRPFIEQHSSLNSPTLAADSPFNRGVRYQLFNVSPSLAGHEGLVREWVIDQEVSKAVGAYWEEHKDDGLTDDALQDGMIGVQNARSRELTDTEAGRAFVDRQVQGYMANPETLHTQILAELRQEADFDANGFTSTVDGTSFSTPEMAGYVSGALYEQSQREEQGRPVLSKDEITTLAKMATIDTTAREGETEPMHAHTNRDGHVFVAGAGHGVFQPEMFRSLLNEAYRRIETNPDIDRNSVTATMTGEVGQDHRGDQPVTLRSTLPEGSDMVIDRMRLEMDYLASRSITAAVIEEPGQERVGTRLQDIGYDVRGRSGWSRMEYHFGEVQRSGDRVNVSLHNGGDTTLQAAQMTVYGYNRGGLMDQMMDYSKELAAKMGPKPEVDPAAPALDNALDKSIPSENRLTADPPAGPR